MSNEQSALETLAEMYARDRERNVRVALESIVKARRELDEIEQQLHLANNGHEYLRIGEVRGADAGAIFAAFGAIERQAQLERVAGFPVA